MADGRSPHSLPGGSGGGSGSGGGGGGGGGSGGQPSVAGGDGAGGPRGPAGRVASRRTGRPEAATDVGRQSLALFGDGPNGSGAKLPAGKVIIK